MIVGGILRGDVDSNLFDSMFEMAHWRRARPSLPTVCRIARRTASDYVVRSLSNNVVRLARIVVYQCTPRGDDVGQLYVNVEPIEQPAVGNRRIYPSCYEVIVAVREDLEAVMYARTQRC
jgi:hypothetical protein